MIIATILFVIVVDLVKAANNEDFVTGGWLLAVKQMQKINRSLWMDE